jgi:hypothetical protein
MIQIKGKVVKDSIDTVKKRSGEQIYNQIIASMNENTRKIFDKNHTILATEWIPLDAFVRFLEMDLKLTANGDENELIKRSEKIIEAQLKGIFKVFVKLGSPQFVINKISITHKSYFKGVSIEVTEESLNKAKIRYIGFEKQHRLIGFAIIGFYKKALEISGAKQIDIKFITSIEHNKGYCDLSISWAI